MIRAMMHSAPFVQLMGAERLTLEACATEIRRFRPGLDYTLAPGTRARGRRSTRRCASSAPTRRRSERCGSRATSAASRPRAVVREDDTARRRCTVPMTPRQGHLDPRQRTLSIAAPRHRRHEVYQVRECSRPRQQGDGGGVYLHVRLRG